MRPSGRKTYKSGHQVSWPKAAPFPPPQTSEHVDFATLPPPLALISFRQQRTLSQATVSLVIMWERRSLNWPPRPTQARKPPAKRPPLSLSWNVFHGMQDALGRKSGRLPNLIGICWLIARLGLTRYPVVLCKQDNIAGKVEERARPSVPSFFAVPVAATEKKSRSAWLNLNRCPTFFPLEWSQPLKVSKYNWSFWFFCTLLQQHSLNQLCACHSLKKSRLFHSRLLVKLLENFKYAALPSWKKKKS